MPEPTAAPHPTGPPGTDVLGLAECWQLLRQGIIGRLAVVVDGEPDIFPINYVVHHASVVFRTDAGRKLTAAVRHPVAFEVDGYDTSDASAWSVVIRGRTEEIRDKDDVIHALTLPLLPWQGGKKPRFMRVIPHAVTGRRIHVEGGTKGSSPE